VSVLIVHHLDKVTDDPPPDPDDRAPITACLGGRADHRP
jgi:hypothetical protein